MSAQKLNKADVVTDFRRAQVMAAARERFTKHGISGTTMDGIAQAAGVAKGTVYLYYKSKDEIFRQILDDPAFKAVVQDHYVHRVFDQARSQAPTSEEFERVQLDTR